MRAVEKAYYDKRAAEYDDWWQGTGLFAGRERPGWDAEVGGEVVFEGDWFVAVRG